VSTKGSKAKVTKGASVTRGAESLIVLNSSSE
jgi:hypothetical protein